MSGRRATGHSSRHPAGASPGFVLFPQSLPFGVWAQGQPLGRMSASRSKSSPLTSQLAPAALPQ